MSLSIASIILLTSPRLGSTSTLFSGLYAELSDRKVKLLDAAAFARNYSWSPSRVSVTTGKPQLSQENCCPLLNNHALLPCRLKKKKMDVDVRIFQFH